MKLNLWNTIAFILSVNIAHKTSGNCTWAELLTICHFAKVIVNNEKNLLFLMFYVNSEMNHKLYYSKTKWVSKVIAILLFLRLI